MNRVVLSDTVIDLVAGLADPERRLSVAADLAAALNARDLLIFIPDPDLGTLLPAPGFPRTLPSGRLWRAFLTVTVERGRYAGGLPLAGGVCRPALGAATADGTVLVLIDGSPDPAAVEAVCRLLPLIGAALRGELALLTAAAQARVAHESAERAQALATALDATRRDLADALAEAHLATRHRDAFLSIASHELKTPIASLWGMAQLLKRRLKRGRILDPETLNDALDLIVGQSAKLTRLIDQLLDVSRIEAGRLRLEPEPADLTALAGSVVQAMQDLVGDHRLTLRAEEPVPAVIDVLRIEQVLINLIDNAVKHSRPAGPIEVAVGRPDAATAVVSVRDWGSGIAAEHLPHIFDRFSQIHQRGRQPGLGIGLFISREIIHLHGGRLDVDCPPDGGSRFVVSLPVDPRHLP